VVEPGDEEPPEPPPPEEEPPLEEGDEEGPPGGGGGIGGGGPAEEFDVKVEVERALEEGFGPEDIPDVAENVDDDPYYQFLADLAEMEPREIFEMFMSPSKHGIAA
jgi:hypothetical protein